MALFVFFFSTRDPTWGLLIAKRRDGRRWAQRRWHVFFGKVRKVTWMVNYVYFNSNTNFKQNKKWFLPLKPPTVFLFPFFVVPGMHAAALGAGWAFRWSLGRKRPNFFWSGGWKNTGWSFETRVLLSNLFGMILKSRGECIRQADNHIFFSWLKTTNLKTCCYFPSLVPNVGLTTVEYDTPLNLDEFRVILLAEWGNIR